MRRTAEEAARTRASLLDAALFLFAERGVTSTKLADVAERAGLTRGAVYHHFEDKNTLFGAVMAESWQSVTVPVWAALDSAAPPEERLREFLSGWLRRLRGDERFRALLVLALGAPHGSGGRSAKADVLADWQRRLETFSTEGRAGPDGEERSRAGAAQVLAWLCGTALLAATDPALLPPDDAPGLAPLLTGALS